MGVSGTIISIENLVHLVGTEPCPVIIDVRTDEDFAADPRLIPASIRRNHRQVAEWGHALAGSEVVLSCQRGLKLSLGAAAILRNMGVKARTLAGGFEAWRAADGMMVPECRLPPGRDTREGTLWVTRERPKIDRIACPWLIRRFVDPQAVFLFVEPSQVHDVASRFDATPFDVEGVFWSHRGDDCTFDTMIEEFCLTTQALRHLALIVRGADTARPELAPQASGLLAVSLGLSRIYADDLEQLDAGMLIYDALYRWCREATEETHNWPAARHG